MPFMRWKLKHADQPDTMETVDESPFATACAVYSLTHVEDETARSVSDNALKFLRSKMTGPGLWRYWQDDPVPLPPDLDDTCLCSFLLRESHPHIIFGVNVPYILKCRNTQGLFRTWVGVEEVDDICPVVNANVLLHLGDRAETEKAAAFVAAVAGGEQPQESEYYLDPLPLLHAASRALYHGAESLAPARERMIERTLALQEAGGGFGHDLNTGMACITLLNCGFGAETTLVAAAQRLLDRQGEDGAWSTSRYFVDPYGNNYGSQALSTAYCLEALVRIYGAYPHQR